MMLTLAYIGLALSMVLLSVVVATAIIAHVAHKQQAIRLIEHSEWVPSRLQLMALGRPKTLTKNGEDTTEHTGVSG